MRIRAQGLYPDLAGSLRRPPQTILLDEMVDFSQRTVRIVLLQLIVASRFAGIPDVLVPADLDVQSMSHRCILPPNHSPAPS